LGVAAWNSVASFVRAPWLGSWTGGRSQCAFPSAISRRSSQSASKESKFDTVRFQKRQAHGFGISSFSISEESVAW
jgi:hypothetical protein